MSTIGLFLALSACPAPVLINKTRLPWNAYDRSILAQAQARCGQLWPDAPCVKVFKKIEKQAYSVVCGRPTNDKET